jgi:phosphatidylserine/phosphatidylglycerophosphate/cardiolipin synthase-like enzyme
VRSKKQQAAPVVVTAPAVVATTGRDPHKTGGFVPGYPANIRTYYSPVDDVHGAILDLVKAARHSLVVAMYGWDDDELQAAILEKAHDPSIYVQLTLDSSQAGGVHERKLLAAWDAPGTSIATGRSEKGAIMHLKMLVVDNAVLVTGSTNWSQSGEDKQDNACVIVSDPYVAGEASARISAIHANMLAVVKPQNAP